MYEHLLKNQFTVPFPALRIAFPVGKAVTAHDVMGTQCALGEVENIECGRAKAILLVVLDTPQAKPAHLSENPLKTGILLTLWKCS